MQHLFKVLVIGTVSLMVASLVGYVQHTDRRLRGRRRHDTGPHRQMAVVAVVAADETSPNVTGAARFAREPLHGELVNSTSSDLSPVGHYSGGGNRCQSKFVAQYRRYCGQRLRPNPSNIPDRWRDMTVDEKAICPCVPSQLLGSLSLFTDRKRPTAVVDRSLQTGSDSKMAGGRWYPTQCIARHRIAIIIPFRNREEHLRQLVYGLHPVLQRQMLDYTIFVVEQLKPVLFNRAALLNVGFVEAKKVGNFDCFFFHDVDMTPKDDRNFYTCSPTPRHGGRYRDTRMFKYPRYFGGVVAISRYHFEKANGYSNQFYGWGGEDDDFRNRIGAVKHVRPSQHYPKCVAGYSTPRHGRDSGNPTAKNQMEGKKFRPKHYQHEGLNTLRYTVVNYERNLLYTKISVNLPPS